MSVAPAIHDIVHQFADRYSFVRELVQNAIDAGSLEVDVDVEYRDGTLVALVHDWGEGMSRDTIESQLVRLFASEKLDDYTKIGRFGIGFASVFAVEPEAVCVDTGRLGESWRILFAPDFTYELFRLDEPVEGTLVRIIKPSAEAEADEFREAVREKLATSCRHAEIPIRFAGDDVRTPFAIESACQLELEEEGTKLLVGVASEGREEFYNRGLLLVDRPATRPWLTFKFDSRYLEHTLTRDALLEDKSYHRAMDLLDRAVERLLDQLRSQLERAAARGEPPGALFRIIPLLPIEADAERWKIVPTRAGPTSLRACKRAFGKGRLWLSVEEDVESDDILVVPGRTWDPHVEVIQDLCQHDETAPRAASLDDTWRVLDRTSRTAICDNIEAMLRGAGSEISAVKLAVIRDRTGAAFRFGVPAFVDVESDRVRSDALQQVDADVLWSKAAITINVEDDVISSLRRLESKEPELSAYALIKYLVCLREQLDPEREASLLAHATRLRSEREGA